MYSKKISLIEEEDSVVISNRFVRTEFSKISPMIKVIQYDFHGNSNYGQNLLSDENEVNSGIILEVIDANGKLLESANVAWEIECEVDRNVNGVKVKINCRTKSYTDYPCSFYWVISLDENSRKLNVLLNINFEQDKDVKVVKVSTYLNQWFLAGLYKKGIVQYVNNENLIFSSTDSLTTVYSMDNEKGSIAIVPQDLSCVLENNLISGNTGFKTGLELVLIGSYPEKDTWCETNWGLALNRSIIKSTVLEVSFDLYPNNYAFPMHQYNDNLAIDIEDIKGLYTAIYGSAAGSLGSYLIPGSVYPTLASPNRSYGEMHTFFDPDSWSTVNALSFSGDTYLQNEAKKVIELAEMHMTNGGQIPHHFILGEPVFVAISGASQTGPNIFWIIATLEYVSGTGDHAWLIGHFERIKAAFNWIMQYYDSEKKLFNVNGPLWTDTFIRQGYTFDTNAMVIRLLDILEPAAKYLKDNVFLSQLTELRYDILIGLEALWDGKDHYITQINADWSAKKDMVDSENYFAVAFELTKDAKRINAIMNRLDSGGCTHPGGRGTWVSEKYYDECDCFNGNTGDSACAMARHWWADEMARSVIGNSESFFYYYNNVRSDLLENTWMTERYDKNGEMIRAKYYHEYPEIITILMREHVYGIDIKLDKITIKPLYKKDSFEYSLGNITVAYRKNKVSIKFPGKGSRLFEIHGHNPDTCYSVENVGLVNSNAEGVIQFHADLKNSIIVEPYK